MSEFRKSLTEQGAEDVLSRSQSVQTVEAASSSGKEETQH